MSSGDTDNEDVDSDDKFSDSSPTSPKKFQEGITADTSLSTTQTSNGAGGASTSEKEEQKEEDPNMICISLPTAFKSREPTKVVEPEVRKPTENPKVGGGTSPLTANAGAGTLQQ